MILSFAGVALLMPLYGFMALAAPTVAQVYRQGQERAMEVATSFFSGNVASTFLLLPVALGILSVLLFAIAIWRCGTLPKWLIIPFLAQAPLLGFPSRSPPSSSEQSCSPSLPG